MIEINNLTSFALDKKLFTGIAKKVLKGENRGRENISLAFVGKEEIKKLNRKYRGKNKPTDVLSFGQYAKYKLPAVNSDLGEIIICPEIVKENAKKYLLTGRQAEMFKKELIKVFVHGIFHLLGYDHEKSEKEALVMEAKEEQYLSKLKI